MRSANAEPIGGQTHDNDDANRDDANHDSDVSESVIGPERLDVGLRGLRHGVARRGNSRIDGSNGSLSCAMSGRASGILSGLR